MSQLHVDIDSEVIHFDGQWMTRDELAYAIRALLEQGQYAVARHSAALESLSYALAEVRTLAFRAAPELADALTQAAASEGRTTGALVRDALSQYLAVQGQGQPALPAAELQEDERRVQPVGRRKTNPELPVFSPEAAGLSLSKLPDPAGDQERGPAAEFSGELPPMPSVVVDPSMDVEVVDSGEESGSLITEAASAEEARHAVDLTPKQKVEPGPDDPERRWFGQ